MNLNEIKIIRIMLVLNDHNNLTKKKYTQNDNNNFNDPINHLTKIFSYFQFLFTI